MAIDERCAGGRQVGRHSRLTGWCPLSRPAGVRARPRHMVGSRGFLLGTGRGKIPLYPLIAWSTAWWGLRPLLLTLTKPAEQLVSRLVEAHAVNRGAVVGLPKAAQRYGIPNRLPALEG